MASEDPFKILVRKTGEEPLEIDVTLSTDEKRAKRSKVRTTSNQTLLESFGGPGTGPEQGAEPPRQSALCAKPTPALGELYFETVMDGSKNNHAAPATACRSMTQLSCMKDGLVYSKPA